MRLVMTAMLQKPPLYNSMYTAVHKGNNRVNHPKRRLPNAPEARKMRLDVAHTVNEAGRERLIEAAECESQLVTDFAQSLFMPLKIRELILRRPETFSSRLTVIKADKFKWESKHLVYLTLLE